jgi:structure-specific endonuclease subunit SLX1
MDEKKWYNYIIFDKLFKSKKTYIGSTVNPTRRFRQHNQEIKGGAKYTKGGQWVPYIILYDINHTKSSTLSYEWHLKNSSKKFKNLSSHIRRKKAVENFLFGKTSYVSRSYTHILFVNSANKYLTPLVNSSVCLIYLETQDFVSEVLNNWINLIINVNTLKNHYDLDFFPNQ